MTTPETHDRRCEADPIHTSCGCGERAKVRATASEIGCASALSAEAQAQAVDVNDLLELAMRRMIESLTARASAEGRTLLMSTLHLVGEQADPLDVGVLKLAALTVPAGVSPVSPFVLEVADEWMQARGFRR